MKDIEYIVAAFGLAPPFTIEQTSKRTWLVERKYILKSNDLQSEVEKSLSLNRALRQEGIAVAEHLPAANGARFVAASDAIYTLMPKMRGKNIDPFERSCIEVARNTGAAIAKLHKALDKLSVDGIKDSDLMAELDGWICSEIKEKSIEVPGQIIAACLGFEHLYRSLPRQIIHRDVHFGNLLFDGDRLTGFLDFDISQRNARIFDLVYLSSSMLVGRYGDNAYVEKWRAFVMSLLLGYHAENPLFDSETRAIYKMALSIQLIFVAYFSSLNMPEQVAACVDMTKWVFSREDVFTFTLPR